MMNSFQVGIVWAVNSSNIQIKMYNESSDFKYFYEGKEYEGIRNGGYISIARGHIDIICQVESEEIRDVFIKNEETTDYKKKRYERYIFAKCIGYFEEGKFKTGIKYTPIIYNIVTMMSNDAIRNFLAPNDNKKNIEFVIGNDLRYGVDIDLPWNNIFNTHIGIFGNTGSGKSNTLAKMYNTLLNHEKLDLKKSKFVFIDFNGEYTEGTVLTSEKKIYKLNTRMEKGNEKFKITSEYFWNSEVLSILFHATEKTQKPFLNKLVLLRKKYSKKEQNLKKYIKKIYIEIFETTNPKKDSLELIKKVFSIISFENKLNRIQWHANTSKFCNGDERDHNSKYFNGGNLTDNQKYFLDIDGIEINKIISPFEELEIRAILQLIQGIIYNYNQYEHIQPLINKISSSSNSLEKIIEISDCNFKDEQVIVLSLKDVNQEMKKLFPILLAKQYFDNHKYSQESDSTFHLIIDEAHNILSNQSNRESETWKDYRLELFEEIIKEGRKFGFFLTIASQRPADISETLMSQFHNFFIHRLINEKDLKLIDNVISTLDKSSKQMIPTLPQGACIMTGTAFDIPKLIQVFRIKEKHNRPTSDDYNLEKIWEKKK